MKTSSLPHHRTVFPAPDHHDLNGGCQCHPGKGRDACAGSTHPQEKHQYNIQDDINTIANGRRDARLTAAGQADGGRQHVAILVVAVHGDVARAGDRAARAPPRLFLRARLRRDKRQPQGHRARNGNPRRLARSAAIQI